ncbi:MAG: hydrogenase 3 maturation endopeptidase HyCI [Candidatus Omnitrophica bacterium]|nr:hydrogenase 3 maturation endopeptidase HyCI [Candidatus Omnitrophota bacterium]
MKNDFNDIIKDKAVIVGIGNVLKGDDALGPALIEKIKDEVDAVCIDAGSTPENYIGKIIKLQPDVVLLVDACHIERSPGEHEILTKDDILKTGFTTHDLSPVMFIEHLESETKADIYLLAVQPEGVAFGDEMSDSVKKAIEEIADWIKEAYNA